METVKRFRLMAVRLALLLTLLAGAVALAFDVRVTKGILLGGLGGVLAFWITAVGVEKLATLPPGKVKFSVYKWTVIRLIIYAAVLVRAYTIDAGSMHALWGAVGGIFVIRIVVLFLGLTGLDLKEAEDKEK